MTKKIKIKIVEGSGCDPCSAAAPLPKNPRRSSNASHDTSAFDGRCESFIRSHK